jgi:sodium/potassium-transporting ATPase subunit alpha
MGNIAKLVTGIKREKTPIAIEISRFTKIITLIAIFNGILFFAICMGFGLEFFTALIFMIGIIVGNIPEGEIYFEIIFRSFFNLIFDTK